MYQTNLCMRLVCDWMAKCSAVLFISAARASSIRFFASIHASRWLSHLYNTNFNRSYSTQIFGGGGKGFLS